MLGPSVGQVVLHGRDCPPWALGAVPGTGLTPLWWRWFSAGGCDCQPLQSILAQREGTGLQVTRGMFLSGFLVLQDCLPAAECAAGGEAMCASLEFHEQ